MNGAATLRWTAPELLSGVSNVEDILEGTPAGDAYSFGIIMSEVWTREQPYDDFTMSAEEVITAIADGASKGAQQGWVHANIKGNQVAPMNVQVKSAWPEATNSSGTLRPTIKDDCPEGLKQLMEQCWHPDPEQRPTFREVAQRLDTLHPTRGSMVDNLISMVRVVHERA